MKSIYIGIATLLFFFPISSAAAQTPSKRRDAPIASARQTVYVLRLKPGQDLRRELQNFARSAGLKAGYIITCVGSLDRATLRLANQNDYAKFEGKFEIVSLVGTLTADGQHLHMSISDKTGQTIGGHLVEGCPIYTTAEIVIGEAEEIIFTREKDEVTGYDELRPRRRRAP